MRYGIDSTGWRQSAGGGHSSPDTRLGALGWFVCIGVSRVGSRQTTVNRLYQSPGRAGVFIGGRTWRYQTGQQTPRPISPIFSAGCRPSRDEPPPASPNGCVSAGAASRAMCRSKRGESQHHRAERDGRVKAPHTETKEAARHSLPSGRSRPLLSAVPRYATKRIWSENHRRRQTAEVTSLSQTRVSRSLRPNRPQRAEPDSVFSPNHPSGWRAECRIQDQCPRFGGVG